MCLLSRVHVGGDAIAGFPNVGFIGFRELVVSGSRLTPLMLLRNYLPDAAAFCSIDSARVAKRTEDSEEHGVSDGFGGSCI